MAIFLSSKNAKSSGVKRKHNLGLKEKSKNSIWSKLSKTTKKTSIRGESTKKEIEKPYQLIFDFGLNHDKKLMYIFLVFLAIGIIAIFSSTIVFASRYNNDKYYYLISQLRFIGIGTLFLLVFYFIRLEFLTKLWYIPYGLIIILLIYLVFLSFTTNDSAIDGATRWVQLAGFQFQPSEFAKLFFLVFVTAFLSFLPENYRDTKDYLRKNLIPFGVAFFLVVGLILLGKNLGTALVVGFIGMSCYFISAHTKFQKAGFLVLVVLITVGGILFGIYESYRADRIDVWTTYLKTGDTLVKEVNPETKEIYYSRENRAYQFDQVLTACGTGGVWGQGLGQSIGKYYFVKTTAGDDSIICIIGEELGFPITAMIIILYIYLVYVCLNLSKKLIEKPVPYYILIGFACWVGFQMFVHIGANLGVIPLTGQTLPFISLGGSSIIALMGGMGLALNASKQIPS